MRLEHPKAGIIQQGAIFNCVIVRRYEKCSCHGIVLTARCDLAHGKYTIINYLPIVRFSDWIQRDMCHHLAKRLFNDLSKSITNTLKNRGISDKVQETFPLYDIITKELKGKELSTSLEKLSQLELLKRVISLGGTFSPDWKAVVQIDNKQCDSLIKELIQQKLGEYYFLDAVDIFGVSKEGYVVLLRNMQTMDSILMNEIERGISNDGSAGHEHSNLPLSFLHEPICLITGVLRSPDIEHLAQQFATLFIRIGLDDHDDSTIERHHVIAKV